MNDINFKIQNFKMNIEKNIEFSELPIGVVYYLLVNILNDIEKKYYAYLNTQIVKGQQEEKSEESQGQAN